LAGKTPGRALGAFARVAVIRSATEEYVTIANEPPRDETEPPELHVTDTTPGSTASGVFAALPFDHSFIDDGAASRLSWDVTGPSPTPVPRAANNVRHVERTAHQVTKNVLRVYRLRR